MQPNKANVININLINKEIFFYFLSKDSRIGFAHYKAVLEKEIPKAFIPYSRSLLKPIEHLMELVHMVEMFGIFKTRGLLNTYILARIEVHSRKHS